MYANGLRCLRLANYSSQSPLETIYTALEINHQMRAEKQHFIYKPDIPRLRVLSGIICYSFATSPDSQVGNAIFSNLYRTNRVLLYPHLSAACKVSNEFSNNNNRESRRVMYTNQHLMNNFTRAKKQAVKKKLSLTNVSRCLIIDCRRQIGNQRCIS
jgi:hypothetical protein